MAVAARRSQPIGCGRTAEPTDWLWPLAASYISSRHLRVTRCEAGFRVKDLSSTNGTFLDEVRLYEAIVPLHTVLRVGETELYFEPLALGQPQAPFHGMVGTDPAVRLLVDFIRRVASSSALVTVLGESGTGKELVAKALHACSRRAHKPFIPINCAALTPSLIESELFGHEKGAFTGADSQRKGAFEAAHGGTLFLDEVGTRQGPTSMPGTSKRGPRASLCSIWHLVADTG